MTPEQLRAENFARYPAAGRDFAIHSLDLLHRLPIAVCPSFLQQMLQFDTSFPAERAVLQRQCDALAGLPADQFSALIAPLAGLSIPVQLQQSNWVNIPAAFIAELTAYLWSSGQIDQFRKGVEKLFAAISDQAPSPHRLTIIVLGREAKVGTTPFLEKLQSRGVLLTALQTQQMSEQIYSVFVRHAQDCSESYAHWYVDGGEPWTNEFSSIPGTVSISYPALDSLRKRTLARMEQMTQTSGAGAEAMRMRLAGTSARDLDAYSVTADPVLARFYTELFSQSSGPQIFSTSFVQWTGRELARRARPHTVLLRYAPRQRYQPFDELLRISQPQSVDPDGSLRDAEMGAYYTWIEMERITSRGKGTFVGWLEGTANAVLVGSSAPRGAVCTTPMRLDEALRVFG